MTDENVFSRRGLVRAAIGGLIGGGVAGSLVFQRALAAQVEARGAITTEAVKAAEWVAGLDLDDDQREKVVRSVRREASRLRDLRSFKLDNSVSPSFDFRCATARDGDADKNATDENSFKAASGVAKPDSDSELAFASVVELASLLRAKQVSSTELTKLYLSRLERLDPKLLCVVHRCDELALAQAKQADEEIAQGKFRGPLHGIPWGAKDLMAYPGYPTTWGAPQLEKTVRKDKATVASRLDEAGAVLVAKLSLGALAMGDRWFGGMTRNPWNLEQGSSGSSAGPASAAAAGLVGFAIGSETLGSIVSPCTRCGVSGLRPTFGRVSRAGCMALSWTMDKIGPIARSIEDCAYVFDAIRGVDGIDTTVIDREFSWPARKKLSDLRVGFFPDLEGSPEWTALKELGVQLVPVQLPSGFPVGALRLVLSAEAAAAFDEWTRDEVDEGLNSWPDIFRSAQFTSAVDYIRAQRVRGELMRAMEQSMKAVDLYFDTKRRDLTLTNLTGHPTAVLPRSIDRVGKEAHVARSITFTGRLFGESDLLAVATAWQQATGVHLRRPPLA